VFIFQNVENVDPTFFLPAGNVFVRDKSVDIDAAALATLATGNRLGKQGHSPDNGISAIKQSVSKTGYGCCRYLNDGFLSK
jgi:hypothetical protein